MILRCLSSLAFLSLILAQLYPIIAHSTHLRKSVSTKVVDGDDTKDELAHSIKRRLQVENKQARYLAVFEPLDRIEVLGTIKHNVQEHFLSSEWDCVVLMRESTKEIPEDNADLMKISEQCMVLPIKQGLWWVEVVDPTIIEVYERVAIHLNDVFLPSKGVNKISVPGLLKSMEENNLAIISPSIAGAGEHYSTHPKRGPMSKCLAEVEMIELYFQIYTREAWNCFYYRLHISKKGGHCYDRSIFDECGGLYAIDYRMVAHHLETKWPNIPSDARVANINFLPKNVNGETAFEGGIRFCETNHCDARIDIWQTKQHPIVCNVAEEDDETVKDLKVMHTYANANVALMKLWSDAWKLAGWDTKILTIEDAKRSPGYGYAMTMLENFPLSKAKVLEYLAMSTVRKGGWFSDPVIFPLYPESAQKEAKLPNDGRLTAHEMPWQGLISASQTEWHRFVRFLVEHRANIVGNRGISPFEKLHEMKLSNSNAFHFHDNIVHEVDNQIFVTSQVCDILEKEKSFAIRFHYGSYLDAAKKKGLINDNNIASYAEAWMKEFQNKCFVKEEMMSKMKKFLSPSFYREKFTKTSDGSPPDWLLANSQPIIS